MHNPTHNLDESAPSLFVQFSQKGRTLLARLVGPSIGQREATIISTAAIEWLDGCEVKPQSLILDFSRINFMNSAGLGMCIQLCNRMSAIKGRTILYGLNDELLAVLKMSRIDRLFSVARTEKELARLAA